MPLNKQAIAHRFDAASASYDEVASVQQQAAEFLVQQVRARWPEFYPLQVIDLGAGSGYVTHLLSAYFPTSQFILNDLSPQLLARAKLRFNDSVSVRYQCGDFDQLRVSGVDLAISNLALQWSGQLAETLRTSYLNSKRLAFSCLLDGTFKAWEQAFADCNLPSPVHAYWSQADYEQVLLALQPQAYSFATQTIGLEFANAQAVMRYLHQLGASLGRQTLSPADLKRVIKRHERPIQLTYQLFFAFLTRSDACDCL